MRVFGETQRKEPVTKPGHRGAGVQAPCSVPRKALFLSFSKVKSRLLPRENNINSARGVNQRDFGLALV